MWSEREKGPPMTERNKKVLTIKGKSESESSRGTEACCARMSVLFISFCSLVDLGLAEAVQ